MRLRVRSHALNNVRLERFRDKIRKDPVWSLRVDMAEVRSTLHPGIRTAHDRARGWAACST